MKEKTEAQHKTLIKGKAGCLRKNELDKHLMRLNYTTIQKREGIGIILGMTNET